MAAILILSQIELNSQLSRCASFLVHRIETCKPQLQRTGTQDRLWLELLYRAQVSRKGGARIGQAHALFTASPRAVPYGQHLCKSRRGIGPHLSASGKSDGFSRVAAGSWDMSRVTAGVDIKNFRLFSDVGAPI